MSKQLRASPILPHLGAHSLSIWQIRVWCLQNTKARVGCSMKWCMNNLNIKHFLNGLKSGSFILLFVVRKIFCIRSSAESTSTSKYVSMYNLVSSQVSYPHSNFATYRCFLCHFSLNIFYSSIHHCLTQELEIVATYHYFQQLCAHQHHLHLATTEFRFS